MSMKYSLAFVVLFVIQLTTANWDVNNYPNPTTQLGAQQCGLRSAGQLCDPDGILTEQERYRLNHELTRLESRTHQEFGRDFCEKKGLTTLILLAKNVKGGTEQDVRRIATELRQRWSLDQQCAKAVVIFVSIKDRKFWVSRDARVPVYAAEFSQLLNDQKEEFKQERYVQGLLNIVQGTADAAVAKQGQLPTAPPFTPGDDRKDRGPVGGGGLPFKIPHIPMWVILAIVFVVIPLLCCCCCVYFCCCRSKSGGVRRQTPADDPEAAGQPQNDGGMGDRLRGLLSGAGGGALMSLIQNCFQNRGHRSAAPPPDDVARGGYVPPRPQAEEGKGLYPAKAIEDSGAGGEW